MVAGRERSVQTVGHHKHTGAWRALHYLVYVSDRYYSTVARLSLRFTVVESLRGEITTAVSRSSDNSALLSITNNNVYDVTEGGACSRLRAHFSAS